MPNITVTRSARLFKGQTGLGTRMTTGTILGNFGFAGINTSAGSLGLTSIDRIFVHPGSIGYKGALASFSTQFRTAAAVSSGVRGSPGNRVTIQGYMEQIARIGSITTTSAYVVFPVAFTGTPAIFLSQGSPNGTIVGSPATAVVQKITSGSFRVRMTPGSPTAYRENRYQAVGPGSFPIYYTAIGD